MIIRQGRRSASIALLVTMMAVAGGGCGNEPASPTSPALPAQQAATNFGGGLGPGGTLGADALAAMNVGIQDEYHAEFTYMRVIEEFGEVLPFFNILYAEERHSAAIARLFVNYGLPVPESRWNLNNVPVFGSLAEACAGGVSAELENIALYDDFLTLDLPQDVRNVFTNIRAASLENHLPAFEACCACSR